jgi:hypothetical protein
VLRAGLVGSGFAGCLGTDCVDQAVGMSAMEHQAAMPKKSRRVEEVEERVKLGSSASVGSPGGFARSWESTSEMAFVKGGRGQVESGGRQRNKKG